MGLDVYLVDKAQGKTLYPFESGHVNDPVYPTHMFKLNYMRSSYNAGGINRVLEECGCPDLYQIFGYEDDKLVEIKDADGEPMHVYQSNYDIAKENLQTVIEKMKAMGRSYRSEFIEARPRQVEMITSDSDSLELFKDVLSKHTEPEFNQFHSSSGMYTLNGLQVYAVIPGSRQSTFMGKQIGAYIITATEAKDREWYVQALEIAQRLCDYAKEHDYAMYWSY